MTKKYKTAITYGTFDLFHIGHLNILKRISACSERLVVGISSDEFNLGKNKKSIFKLCDRLEIVSSLRCVDEVFVESSWDQKVQDIKKYNADVFFMGEDWKGKFDDQLNGVCRVEYLPRTENISTTSIKDGLRIFDKNFVDELENFVNISKAVLGALK